MKPLHLLVLLFAFSFTTRAQQGFEGKIVTKVEIIKSSKDMKRMAAMLGNELTIFIKGAKSRLVQKNTLGETVIISDSTLKESTVLMDLMGKKMGIKMSGENAESNSMIPQSAGSYTTTTEHKTILGYDCVKTIFTLDDKSGTFEIWTTTAIPNFTQSYRNLNGFPLEYTMVSPDAHIKFTTTEIAPMAVSDDYFTIPQGYEIKSQEEMSKMLPSIGHE